MKSPHSITAFVCALTFSFAGLALADNAVSIRLEQATKSDMNPKDKLNRTHSRTINVFVTNNSANPVDLKVKYIVFGRDMLEHKMVTVGQGENPVSVKPHSTEKVDTAETKVTASEAHFDTKTKKKVEASGATIVGVGVQVLQGSTMVAESYDPPSLKDQWGKTPPKK
jgi:hypothetical protein